MKDIQTLLSRAKFGTAADRTAYTEAVQTMSNADPVGYLSRLKYIIASGAGMKSINAFMEKHEILPIRATQMIYESAIEMLDLAEKRSDAYPEAYQMLIEKTGCELDRHQSRLAMFEEFKQDMPKDYMKCLFEGGITAEAALTRFGAGALPDCLIGCFGESADQVAAMAATHVVFASPVMKQWLVESTKDLQLSDDSMAVIISGSLTESVNAIFATSDQLYRESFLLEDELYHEYSESDVIALAEYASFQENLVTSLRTSDAILHANESAMRANLELDGLIDESCADIAAMLPTGQSPRILNEGLDRVTGGVPDFIGKNHNVGYGEVDSTTGKYEKPKKIEPTKPSDSNTDDIISDEALKRFEDLATTADDVAKTAVADAKSSSPGTNAPAAVTNYYNYYNSFNRTKHDQSSRGNVTNANTSTVKDDHSTGKTTNNGTDGNRSNSIKESANAPWSLDIGGVYMSEIGPIKRLHTPKPPMNYIVGDFTSEENVIRPNTARGFRLFPKKKPAVPAAPAPVTDTNETLNQDSAGFTITPGTLTEEQISEKLTVFLRKEYHATENKVIALVKTLAGNEHKILGNVVMEPGLETMWTDLYHIEDMLFNEFSNVVFHADNGETILFEHLIGSYTMDPSKVTQEKFDAMLAEYKIDPSKILVDPLDKKPIAEWGRREWGYAAELIFESMSLVELRAMTDLPKNVRFDVVFDDTLWDGVIGARIVFTDLDATIAEFNKSLGDNGSVTFDRDAIMHSESTTFHEKTNAAPTVEPEAEDPDADPERPVSDHPIKDTIQDIDRVLTRKGAETKKKVNDVINVGKVIAKPAKRTAGWINNLIIRFKDADETKIKEQMADPHERSVLFKGIRAAITTGSLYKAGLLLNPVFLFLAVTRTIDKRKNRDRLRTDVIGQLRTEIEITDEKIKDADRAGDNAEKYKLMRFRNEFQKKLIRVTGGKELQRVV